MCSYHPWRWHPLTCHGKRRLWKCTICRRLRYVQALKTSQRPFTLPANGLPDAQQSASANASGLVYSGYVQAGKEALAIIGGLEYGVGDTLPNTGDVIRFIGSDGVRLYSPSRNAEWTLPYSGDDI